MKRILTFLLCFAAIASLSRVPASGAGLSHAEMAEIAEGWRRDGYIDERGGVIVNRVHYESALFALWEIYGYPDDAGGVYYDSDLGVLVYMIVNPTAERIGELRELTFGDVTVIPSTYSYNELVRAHSEISAEMEPLGMRYSIGIGWGNIGGESPGFGESGREFRVTVGVHESEFERYRDEFARRYGDMVVVEVSGTAEFANSIPLEIGDSVSVATVTEYAGVTRLYIVLGAGLLILGIIVTAVIIKKRGNRKEQGG